MSIKNSSNLFENIQMASSAFGLSQDDQDVLARIFAIRDQLHQGAELMAAAEKNYKRATRAEVLGMSKEYNAPLVKSANVDFERHLGHLKGLKATLESYKASLSGKQKSAINTALKDKKAVAQVTQRMETALMDGLLESDDLLIAEAKDLKTSFD